MAGSSNEISIPRIATTTSSSTREKAGRTLGEHQIACTREGARRTGQPHAVVINSIVTNAGRAYDIGSMRGKKRQRKTRQGTTQLVSVPLRMTFRTDAASVPRGPLLAKAWAGLLTPKLPNHAFSPSYGNGTQKRIGINTWSQRRGRPGISPDSLFIERKHHNSITHTTGPMSVADRAPSAQRPCEHDKSRRTRFAG